MATLHARKAALSSTAAAPNYKGGTQEAFDIIREEGRKAGEVKVKGAIKAGVALMIVAQHLYSTDAAVMKQNQNNAWLSYVEGYNSACKDKADHLSTNPKDDSFQSAASKYGTWIAAGYVFDDLSKVEPFIERLEAAVLAEPMPKGVYHSGVERMLIVLRKVSEDASILEYSDEDLRKMVKPNKKKIAENKRKREKNKATREAAKAKTKEIVKVAEAAATVASVASGKASSDHELFWNAAKAFNDMLERIGKDYSAAMRKRLEKIGAELASFAEDVEKAEKERAEKAQATVEAIKEEAKAEAANAPKPKARRTRGK